MQEQNGYIKAVKDTALYLYFNIKESLKDDKSAKLVTAQILNDIADEYKDGAAEEKKD